MKKNVLTSLAVSVLAISTPTDIHAGRNEDAILRVVNTYVPENSNLGKIKIDKVTVNQKKKTITVKCSDAVASIPLTQSQTEQLKADCLKALGSSYSKYKINLISGKYNLTDLAAGATKTNRRPTEHKRFVTGLDAQAAPAGLDGSNIALWQSHGWYFEPKLNRWEWQRARVQQTVEDLYTQSYVMPFLMPMLQNAGAYVMSPRERDIQAVEYIVDNDNGNGYKEHSGDHKWQKTDVPGFGYKGEVLVNGSHPFAQGTARKVQTVTGDHAKESKATWSADIRKDGDYAVYVSYQTLPNSATDAIYTVNAANGAHRFKVNQKMGGGTWIYLGHFPLETGSDKPIVELSNHSGDSQAVVTADAVKIGGGVGNVARIVKEPLDSIDYKYVLSGYPRFTEAARYWLQWAGAPDSVFTPTDYVNDYNDDYRSRPLWVNWISGGSSMMPHNQGLGIPVDLSFAFHSDAGTTLNDSIIGTLGIYCTESENGKYANGSSRLAARDLTNYVMTDIVSDVRSSFEPNWTRRGMWDKSYAEARIPEVPAMLLELLSHQNFADMKYGLDPTFRFTVSRAIYKGMLKYLAERDGRVYVVQPLPVRSFAITGNDGSYTLRWQHTEDSAEVTAIPSYYIVEERIGASGNAFRQIAKVAEPEYTVSVNDSDIHSYRIIAGNAGGVSFPSEVLALCDMPGKPQVMIVNGFTRVSAPDWFDSGEIAGFYDTRDHGVPYVYDISYIGSQFEFRRDIPWMDDDAAGFGASRSNYEKEVVAGNTFDYVAMHGEAIAAAGYGFISSSVQAFASSEVPAQARVVDLILGKQKEVQIGRGAYPNRFKTFTPELQQKLREYTSAGGNVFVSGSFIATDLWDNLYSTEAVRKADTNFAKDVLGYCWRVGQASVTGEAYEVDSRFKEFTGGTFDFHNTLNPDFYAVESPDSFYAPDKKRGATIMRYSENNLVAGTAFCGDNYRTVAIGFPFETIKSTEARSSLMSQILTFLNK